MSDLDTQVALWCAIHPQFAEHLELARAVRHEAAAAVRYWWGVSDCVVWRWRQTLGVSRTNNEGTRRAIHAAAVAAGLAMHERGLTPQEIEQRRRNNGEHRLWQNVRPGYHGPWWTLEQLELLGTLPDEEVARRTGLTPNAVRVMRWRRGVPPPDGAPTHRSWSPRANALVREPPRASSLP
jgi:hypothetical protein